MIDIRWSAAARDAIWAAGVQAPYRESVAALMKPPAYESAAVQRALADGALKLVRR